MFVRDARRSYLYSRENEAEARQANILTADEARRIAVNIARLRSFARSQKCQRSRSITSPKRTRGNLTLRRQRTPNARNSPPRADSGPPQGLEGIVSKRGELNGEASRRTCGGFVLR
jgi:hypothetical protein